MGCVLVSMTARDEEREERIKMEIIVDAYTQDEQAMGWHIYLEETMDFPFEARCIEEQEVSPLEEGETVRVVDKPSSEPSLRQQFVTIEWMDREFGVPLSQLEPAQASSDTKQAIADWHYWLER
jgi:hypothetical protein